MSQKELIENLNEILDQKNTVLIPENIKSGINILGVEGSSYIVDTSDAIATSNDLLLSKTAYVNGQKVTGTMMDNDHLYFTPSAEDQTIPKGYTEGGTVWGDSNLKPENIKKGVEIFNVIGNYEDGLDTSDATAVASQILLGQTAYVNDVKITGTMPYQGSKIITPSSAPQIFPSGYYSDLQITTDSNLIPENIKSGITIFDVEGTMDPGLDTSDATATSKFIVEGYTAYANGAKITGGLKSSGNVNYTTNNFIRKYSDTAMNFFHQYTEDIAQWRDSRINLIISNTDIASAIDLTAEKILKGNTILGIAGTAELDTSAATVTATDLLEGVTAYGSTGELLIGTMSDNGSLEYTPNETAQEIPKGYTTGGIVKAVDITTLEEYQACLTLANSIDSMEDYSDTMATAGDIKHGKTAYSNGERIIGTLILSGNKLNDEYQPLEYLESNGTQYINTEVYPVAGKHTAVVNYMLTQLVNNKEQWALGQWYYTAGWRCGGYTNSYGSHSKNTSSGFIYTSGGVGEKVLGMSTTCSITSEFPMYMFAQQSAGNAEYVEASYFRIYECKIWENNVLIRDFVPCYRKSDNKPGMYDVVNDVFYINQGTGEFILGPEVVN